MKYTILFLSSYLLSFTSVHSQKRHTKDTIPSHILDRKNAFVNFKFGLGFQVASNPLEFVGLSYKIMPEFEYMLLNKFSVCAALNYLHSNNEYHGTGGKIIEKSAYLGVKKYFSIGRNHALNLNIGYHYGNDYYEADPVFGLNHNLTGGNWTAGFGYQNFPRKLFGHANQHWGYYMDVAYPFASNNIFSFAYAGLGIKYLLNKKK